MKAAEVGKQLKRQPERFHIVAVDIERSNGSRVKQYLWGAETEDDLKSKATLVSVVSCMPTMAI